MVEFGVMMYFLYACVAGIVLAAALGGVLSFLGRMFVPKTAQGRSRLLWDCFTRPFLLIPWTLLVFTAYSYAIGIIFHRDNGLGVDIHAPLPDGYLLGYVNYNLGYFLTPDTSVGKFPNESPGAVPGVTELQLAGPYILGSKFPTSVLKFGHWDSATSEYFLVDTRKRSIATFSTLDDLRNASTSKGVALSLENPIDVYSRYRRIWFDWSFPAVSALGVVVLFVSLWLRISHNRHPNNDLPAGPHVEA